MEQTSFKVNDRGEHREVKEIGNFSIADLVLVAEILERERNKEEGYRLFLDINDERGEYEEWLERLIKNFLALVQYGEKKESKKN